MAAKKKKSTTNDTTKVGGKEMTWNQLVKQYGQDRASQLAPQIDPRYQQDIAAEGKRKGAEDYASHIMDPSTVTAPKGGWSDFGSPSEIASGIQTEESGGGIAGKAAGGVANAVYGMPQAAVNLAHKVIGTPAATIEGGTFGTGGDGGGGGDPSGGGGGHKAPPPKAGPTTPPPPSPAQLMLDSLANEYMSQITAMQPGLTGQAASRSVAADAAAAGVQPLNPAVSGMLAGDQAAVGAAETAGANMMNTALKEEGTALGGELSASPYLGILNALGSGAGYNIERGQSPASKTPLPPGITLAATGLGNLGAGAGANLPVPVPNPNATSASSPTTDQTTASGTSSGTG